MAQILRPDADISRRYFQTSAGGITGLYAFVNDESDLTYLYSPSTSGNGYVVLGLPAPSPPKDGNSTVYFRLRETAFDNPMTISIYEGASLIASHAYNLNKEWTLVSFEVALTDYSDLRIRVECNPNYIGCYQISELWVEVPDAEASAGLEMGCNF